MTLDETPIYECGQDLEGADCECSYEMLAHEPCEEACAWQHAIVESHKEKESMGAACGINCRSRVLGSIDERGNWIASYVRTRLRTMADDAIPISRHTADFAARAVRHRFLSDTDAVLQRILDLAALRYLRDGSSTLTQEDVEVALRSLEHPRR